MGHAVCSSSLVEGPSPCLIHTHPTAAPSHPIPLNTPSSSGKRLPEPLLRPWLALSQGFFWDKGVTISSQIKPSTLQRRSLNSGSTQLKGFRPCLKQSRYTRPLPFQVYAVGTAESSLRPTGLPRRGSDQTSQLAETETSPASQKRLSLTEPPIKDTLICRASCSCSVLRSRLCELSLKLDGHW